MDMQYLHQQLAAVCPIDGVSVGNPADKATWSIQFHSTATAAQQSAAEAVLSAWNASAVHPATMLRYLLAGGVQVTSSSTPALNGTYGTSMQDQVNLTALQTSITAGVPWIGYLRDIIGVSHTMTAVQFTSIAAAILGFVAAADAAYAAAVAGQSPTWPSNQVTVA